MELNKDTYTPETLARMEPAALQQLLMTQLQKQPPDIDDELVRLLLRELEARGKNPAFADDEAVEAACDRFLEDAAKDPEPKFHWCNHWLTAAACVAAILGILLFSLPGIAEAEPAKEVLTRWTDSIFQFFAPGDPVPEEPPYVFKTDNPGLQEIYDAVTELGITEPVVPMWIPEGFELKEIEVFELVEDKMLYASMVQNERYLYISLILHNKKVQHQYEKDTQNLEIIEVMGNDYYIMSNNAEYIVTWWINGTECSVVTDCQEDEVHKLLNSIYTPED